ncbi:hypothetical protein CXG81DRAFT_21287 [Caulochytrium protostelioides]|uniref:Peroxisomal membrane protein PEX16 n=1 Tax=Caulochytrium protostelioides TaxID=1555241 RepID=A0A4P9WYA2_9FUNG|nr:hypothetical protein CXG81DRAFT_21287 [Caulochytrium protostelioides]|eukprot:RKO98489.1 hypothetical protein CXG81DRAFT_21287 [Caulochytrium protostelioides]
MGAAASPTVWAAQSLVKFLILRRIVATSDGRDKVLKWVQYAAKVALLKEWARLFRSAPWARDRASAIATQLSLARRVIRLGHGLEGLQSLYDVLADGGVWNETPTGGEARDALGLDVDGGAPNGAAGGSDLSKRRRPRCRPLLRRVGRAAFGSYETSLDTCNTLVGIVNDVVDDYIALGKLGVVDKQRTKPWEPVSDRLWCLTILVDLRSAYRACRNAREAVVASRNELRSLGNSPFADQPSCVRDRVFLRDRLQKLRQKRFLAHVSLCKLGCDFIFNFYDVHQLEARGFGPGIQAYAGLCAATLNLIKVWSKFQ